MADPVFDEASKGGGMGLTLTEQQKRMVDAINKRAEEEWLRRLYRELEEIDG